MDADTGATRGSGDRSEVTHGRRGIDCSDEREHRDTFEARHRGHNAEDLEGLKEPPRAGYPLPPDIMPSTSSSPSPASHSSVTTTASPLAGPRPQPQVAPPFHNCHSTQDDFVDLELAQLSSSASDATARPEGQQSFTSPGYQRDTPARTTLLEHEGRPLTRSPPPVFVEDHDRDHSQRRRSQDHLPRPVSSVETNTHLTTSTAGQTRVSSSSGALKEKPEISDDETRLPRERDRDVGRRLGDERSGRSSRRTSHHLDAPLPALPRHGSETVHDLRRGRTRTMDGLPPSVHLGGKSRSGLDWIVPVDEKAPIRSRTISERLQPTIDVAKEHRDKFAKKARFTGYLLNGAIGLQIVLGSLTTGLSAVATTGKQMALQTTILGGMTTIVAGYLARTRGSNEPELSKMRVKDLEKFIREATSFVLDFGHLDDPKYDGRVEELRQEFEELLGNATQDRKAIEGQNA